MAENSKIEWTDHTFNPWMGCTKVSDGCKHCYAEQMMDKHWNKVRWGPQGVRVKTSEAIWRKPYKWDESHVEGQRRQRVFCASLADIFEDNPQVEEWRKHLFFMIECTTNLDWLLLTKRPQNVLQMVPQRWLASGAFPRNIWMGTSVENQKAADERIPHLVKVPAVVKFLSCEPLLERVELELRGKNYGIGDEFVNWVICGGESGPHARVDVPFLFKQWGGVNKKKNGRLLDGVEWNQFPEVVTP